MVRSLADRTFQLRLEQLRHLFRVFDADDDSCITPDEIFDMYIAIRKHDVSKSATEVCTDSIFEDELSLQEARRLYLS